MMEKQDIKMAVASPLNPFADRNKYEETPTEEPHNDKGTDHNEPASNEEGNFHSEGTDLNEQTSDDDDEFILSMFVNEDGDDWHFDDDDLDENEMIITDEDREAWILKHWPYDATDYEIEAAQYETYEEYLKEQETIKKANTPWMHAAVILVCIGFPAFLFWFFLKDLV